MLGDECLGQACLSVASTFWGCCPELAVATHSAWNCSEIRFSKLSFSINYAFYHDMCTLHRTSVLQHWHQVVVCEYSDVTCLTRLQPDCTISIWQSHALSLLSTGQALIVTNRVKDIVSRTHHTTLMWWLCILRWMSSKSWFDTQCTQISEQTK